MSGKKSEIGNLEDCSLIEMLHLHDCIRTSLQSLVEEVELFARCMESNASTFSELRLLSRKMYGRFQIIWSVFQAHSSAEDEFLWPAVEATGYAPGPKPKNDSAYQSFQVSSDGGTAEESSCKKEHAEEQDKFVQIDKLLFKLREMIDENKTSLSTLQLLVSELAIQTRSLLRHLARHLDREEQYYIPIVKEKLSVSEINDLIGQIMGRRSATTMANILDLALENLHGAERISMLEHMKEALSGTFFGKWLQMSGWTIESKMDESEIKNNRIHKDTKSHKRQRLETSKEDESVFSSKPKEDYESVLKILRSKLAAKMTSGSSEQSQLSKMIIAILENPSLPNDQKISTIRCLTDSVSRISVSKIGCNTSS